MKYYAAYGSNLHLEQMKERCPNAIPIGTARLADWKLVFKGDKGEFYLSIVPKQGLLRMRASGRWTLRTKPRLMNTRNIPRCTKSSRWICPSVF
ncbi:gamma-glutamylcyclotransferase family protein [Allobaculum sp. Allo2]|uniref:gamma-glutamylcyclotransferase family protein n=1 Tax=Allobaculum sp. Allo2 TaxID=2853432 RepID=UPI001F619861|nr:gamma-glutamylcyclotransferase family protein [Allobaculum sp. Allo2]UNT92780.1 gamma-glutamylcyclotransferase [Allobaculum sp. Allo2]